MLYGLCDLCGVYVCDVYGLYGFMIFVLWMVMWNYKVYMFVGSMEVVTAHGYVRCVFFMVDMKYMALMWSLSISYLALLYYRVYVDWWVHASTDFILYALVLLLSE